MFNGLGFQEARDKREELLRSASNEQKEEIDRLFSINLDYLYDLFRQTEQKIAELNPSLPTNSKEYTQKAMDEFVREIKANKVVTVAKCEAVHEVVSLEISTECEESFEIEDITPVVSVAGEIEYEYENEQDFRQSSHSPSLKRMGQ